MKRLLFSMWLDILAGLLLLTTEWYPSTPSRRKKSTFYTFSSTPSAPRESMLMSAFDQLTVRWNCFTAGLWDCLYRPAHTWLSFASVIEKRSGKLKGLERRGNSDTHTMSTSYKINNTAARFEDFRLATPLEPGLDSSRLTFESSARFPTSSPYSLPIAVVTDIRTMMLSGRRT